MMKDTEVLIFPTKLHLTHNGQVARMGRLPGALWTSFGSVFLYSML